MTVSFAARAQSVDILIKGGTIYDGSDAKPYVGDIAISGDRIVFVGPKASMSAKRTIDATGMVVSPGFVDGHAHPDHFLDDADPQQRQNAQRCCTPAPDRLFLCARDLVERLDH
jgi:N-acyl-D-amino-acid deacylase